MIETLLLERRIAELEADVRLLRVMIASLTTWAHGHGAGGAIIPFPISDEDRAAAIALVEQSNRDLQSPKSPKEG